MQLEGAEDVANRVHMNVNFTSIIEEISAKFCFLTIGEDMIQSLLGGPKATITLESERDAHVLEFIIIGEPTNDNFEDENRDFFGKLWVPDPLSDGVGGSIFPNHVLSRFGGKMTKGMWFLDRLI